MRRPYFAAHSSFKHGLTFFAAACLLAGCKPSPEAPVSQTEERHFYVGSEADMFGLLHQSSIPDSLYKQSLQLSNLLNISQSEFNYRYSLNDYFLMDNFEFTVGKDGQVLSINSSGINYYAPFDETNTPEDTARYHSSVKVRDQLMQLKFKRLSIEGEAVTYQGDLSIPYLKATPPQTDLPDLDTIAPSEIQITLSGECTDGRYFGDQCTFILNGDGKLEFYNRVVTLPGLLEYISEYGEKIDDSMYSRNEDAAEIFIPPFDAQTENFKDIRENFGKQDPNLRQYIERTIKYSDIKKYISEIHALGYFEQDSDFSNINLEYKHPMTMNVIIGDMSHTIVKPKDFFFEYFLIMAGENGDDIERNPALSTWINGN